MEAKWRPNTFLMRTTLVNESELFKSLDLETLNAFRCLD